ncbi:hypothetical protein ACLHDG_12490 [Sulfurovum sp. CS9]
MIIIVLLVISFFPAYKSKT